MKPKDMVDQLLEQSGHNLEELRRVQRQTGKSFYSVVLEHTALNEEQLLSLLAQRFALPYRTKIELQDDIPLPTGLKREYLERHYLAPYSVAHDHLLVAAVDPTAFKSIDILSRLFGLPLVLTLAPRSEILRVIDAVFTHQEEREVIRLWDLSREELPDTVRELLDAGVAAANDLPPVIRMVNLILLEAARDQASDIHFESSPQGFRVRYRIDGILYEVHKPPKRLSAPMLARIKVMAGLNVAERRIPQDGRLRLRTRDAEIDVRVATIPAADGERAVLRLLDRTRAVLPLESIGLPPNYVTIIEQQLSLTAGLVLLTGPTGSGKTTTLYSMLNRINSAQRNIITIEDPIEYRLPGINQLQVNERTGFTFANGLRSILRQDPDVIMIGEIRDRATAEIAIQAAMTGHLVLSTLHTNSASEAINRLRDMGIAPYLLADSITLLIGQRLVRLLCAGCKQEIESRLENPKILSTGMALSNTEFRSVGCARCRGTGFKGRTGLFEVVPITEEIRAMIHRGDSGLEVAQHLDQQGFIGIKGDGLLKVSQGLTARDEVVRVTHYD